MSHRCRCESAEHREQHQAFMYIRTSPEPDSGTCKDRERREEEELPQKGRPRVCPWLKRQVAEVAAQIESASRFRDNSVDAGHGEGDNDHGANDTQTSMNGGAVRGHEYRL